MRSARSTDNPVAINELLPQDVKPEVDELDQAEAMSVARYLA